MLIAKYSLGRIPLRFFAPAICLAFVAGCATSPTAPRVEYPPAASLLREARSAHVPLERRAADYLQAAATIASSQLATGTQETPPRGAYNAAAAELTVLLRSSEGGRLWNRPLVLSNASATYHLRFQPASYGAWAPDYFTTFELPGQVETREVKEINIQNGVGGALVGVRAVTPREAFVPVKGIAAPVTATLDFKGTDATLALRQPSQQSMAKVEGKLRPLAADYTAAIAYYRPPSNFLAKKLMATFRPSHYSENMGLYFLQPYDPNRIPVVLIHGLASSPFMWAQPINELQADPQLREHYQFWVFAYPTGYPMLYSALRLREALGKVDKLYPNHHGYVLVGHSMGGILAHMQVVALTPAMWERTVGEAANEVLVHTSRDSLIYRAVVFQANPRIKRVVFICTPHRGSEEALGGLGRLGSSLIKLPFSMAGAIKTALTDVDLSQYTGSARRLNSVSGLSPKNPIFKVVNSAKMTVPCHSIIGDRGKGDSPNSTDGVVPYWSSHLDDAQSELIVPGPHGSFNLPQTIAELRRILLLHLKTSGALRRQQRLASYPDLSQSEIR